MSRQAIDDFRKLIAQEKVLQEKANELAAAKAGLAEWVAFGKENGFEFSEADAAAFAEEAQADSFELTEFEMEFVSAGYGPGDS